MKRNSEHPRPVGVPADEPSMQLDDPRRTARQLLPFLGVSLLAWIAVPIGSSMKWGEYAISATLVIVTGVVRLLPLRGKLAKAREAIPSLIFLIAIALLRDSAGGINSAVGVLALLPVFYTALYSDRRQLCAVLIGMATLFLTQNLLVGPPAYPHTQYRAGVLFITVSTIIGLTTQWLVAQARFQATEARDRERLLQQVATVVRNLSSSPHARAEVCEAARTISNASLAVLYEPTGPSGALRSSSMVGIAIEPLEIGPHVHSSVREAFLSGRSLFFADDCESQFLNADVWELAGRPEAVLFEPLLRGTVPVGVLVVGWPSAVKVGGSRTTTIALLAHEVATVIERADMLTQLAGIASTDALTGLPNRRAWDEHLSQALAEDQQATIAMLDLDHFKEFNDTQGHPAGDRLLRETAAAWREELRAGDFVARIGGDEFALLLPNCNSTSAMEVVERLRLRIPGEQTCSAGISGQALSDAAPDTLMARADTALYEAKTAGRNRTCLTG
jgi:diguanylate cyclase (GGDEF)-like protein